MDHRGLLAVQGVLTFVPFALFGGQWAQGVAGLLAGLVLLTLPGRLSWPLAGWLAGWLAAGGRCRGTGRPRRPALGARLVGSPVGGRRFRGRRPGFFGLVRLSDLVAELQSARGRFAELAGARERLQAAEDLQAAVGERLAGVAAMTAAAQQAWPGNPAGARAQMEAAGVAARDAVARARAVTADRRMAPGPEPLAAATGADIAPRLAWAILVVILCGFGLGTANNIYLAHLDPGDAAALLASAAACVALQLYHSRPALEGRPPRAWPLTLAVQTVLVYLPFVLLRGYVNSLVGFAAGSFLLLVPGRWRWAGYAAVVASWSALCATVPQAGQPPQQGWADVLYVTAVTAGVGLMV
jgi:two-component system, NarL family, sensor histidine kinase DesK